MKRPIGVILLALLLACYAALILDAILIGLAHHDTLGLDVMILSVLRMLVAARFAFGLWSLRDWARRAVILFAVLRIVIQGSFMMHSHLLPPYTERVHLLGPSIPLLGFQYSGQLNLLLILGIVVYLMSSGVRESFDKSRWRMLPSHLL